MTIIEPDTVYVALSRCSAVTESAAELYRPLLSADELERNARFRFPRDRHRDLIARGLVRSTLGKHLDCDPASLVFNKDAHGKPALSSPDFPGPVCFNISHSGDWVVLAVARQPVGIDVEYVKRENNLLAIADRYFFGKEYAELRSYPEEEQRQRFFDYWTLKEAYMKARGEGLGLGLSNFGFEVSDGIRLHLNESIEDNPQDWCFYCLTPETDYRLSLAVKTSGRPRLLAREVQPLLSESPLDWLAT